MAPYNEEYSVGTFVQIANLSELEDFERSWKYHNALERYQLEFAEHVAEVSRVSFYHGGDVLYELLGVPGIWHEECLRAKTEQE